MSKTKIILIFVIVILLISGIGFGVFALTQPKKSIVKNGDTGFSASSSTSLSTNANLFKKSNFDNSKKSIIPDQSTNPDDFKTKKFTDSTGQQIKETDLNTYSKVRDESKIYSDDFVNANCESYNLTVNSSQNCYINFRKEILDSEEGKIKAKIVNIENSEVESETGNLSCNILKVEQNPNKNALSCTTNNLKVKTPGNYNLTLIIGEDILNNSLEKNIEVLTVDEFQTKYNQTQENQEIIIN